MKLSIKALKEIVMDFMSTGLDLNVESFLEWSGFKLDARTLGVVSKEIYKMA